MTPYDALNHKLRTGEALAGVIGLGYVGLPLTHALCGGGLRVIGFDNDPKKIEKLAKGETYLGHLGDEMVRELGDSGLFEATSDTSRLSEPDVIVVCLPTPLGRHREPDLSFVLDNAREIGKALRPAQLVILESTTYPGTTRNDFLPALLAATGPGSPTECGRDFFVAYSPEREDPGSRGTRDEDDSEARRRLGREDDRARRGVLPSRDQGGGRSRVGGGR